jgi:hypothetical protein
MLRVRNIEGFNFVPCLSTLAYHSRSYIISTPINPRKSPLTLPDSYIYNSLTTLSTCALPALAEFGDSTAAVTLSYIFSLRGNGARGLEWDRGGRKSVHTVGVDRDDG